MSEFLKLYPEKKLILISTLQNGARFLNYENMIFVNYFNFETELKEVLMEMLIWK